MPSLHRHRSKRRSDLLGNLMTFISVMPNTIIQTNSFSPELREKMFSSCVKVLSRVSGRKPRAKAPPRRAVSAWSHQKYIRSTPNMIKWKWLLWKIWSCLQPIEAGHANSSDNGEKDFELDKRQDVPGAVFLKQIVACNASTVTLILLFTRGYNQWHLPLTF